MEESIKADQGEYGADKMPQEPVNEKPAYLQAKKQLSKLGLRYLLGSILIFAVQNISIVVVNFLKPEWISNTNGQLLVSMLSMYIIAIPILYLMIKGLPAVKPATHKMGAGKFVLAAIICYALTYCSNIIGIILTTIIGLIKGGEVHNTIVDVVSGTNLWVIFFIMVICAPIIEELVFRKLIVDRTMRYGQGVAILISGLMFGLFHGNLNQFIYAFALGLFFAFLYVKTGNVIISIAIHMIINFMGSILGMLVLKLVDYEAVMELSNLMVSGASQAELMSAVMGILPNLIIYLAYIGLLLVITITGMVLFIVAMCKGKLKLEPGEIVIPRGKRFTTVICNLGVIVYCIFWGAIIVWQLFI